jgi:hypothetical protein
MIKTPPQHNTTNPPGQFVNPIEWNGRPPRYLKDIVKAAQERSSETPGHLQAPTPLDDSKERLQRLQRALLEYCEYARSHANPAGRVVLEEIRNIVAEST